MRFRRWPHVSPYEDTPRKRAALARTQREQRERLPLLRDLIAERQPSADAEMARRAEWWSRIQRQGRDHRAADWRRARTRLARYGENLRSVIRQMWRDCPYPADPVYLLDLLHAIDAGRIDPECPPWNHPQALRPRTTPNPVSFDKAFHRIGQRKIGGGPNTTEADEFTFVGNLGNGILFLTSRVRLIDPHESFYTSSNHRLRDSHVGRSGHWVDITVRGLCFDAELVLIERLAQTIDDRPVIVRRTGQAPSATARSVPNID
jgi:hypothetical protein